MRGIDKCINNGTIIIVHSTSGSATVISNNNFIGFPCHPARTMTKRMMWKINDKINARARYKIDGQERKKKKTKKKKKTLEAFYLREN